MNENQQGLSLFEALIATLMVTVVILGFIHLQSILIDDLERTKKRLKGERAAFQLLEVYPDLIVIDLPKNWTSQLITQSYNQHCKIVKVSINPDLGKVITQERLFCQ